jgi:hypothetical protein
MAKPQARSTTAEKVEELCDGQRPPLQLTAAAALARASSDSSITLMTRETRSPDLKELTLLGFRYNLTSIWFCCR